MSGLRARQKAARRRRIVEAAAVLFRRDGFENTKTEAIAQRAEVSVGSVYNYFESKGDLLVAIVALEANEVLNAGAAMVASPPDDVENAINGLIGIYLDHSLNYLDKDMWRNAMAISTVQPDSPSGREYSNLDERLSAQVCALIERLREAGLVHADVDTDAVGQMLFNNTNMMFTWFVKSEAMGLDALKAAIRRQIRPLARAIGGEVISS